MENQSYLMIENNVVTNIVIWNGDISQWNPPSDATMLIQSETKTKIWELNSDNTDYILTESIGDANIGFTYDGEFCITNEEKPPIPVTDK